MTSIQSEKKYMKNLTPHLMFNGNCEEAMNFYKECFGGEIGYMGRYRDSPMEVHEEQKNKIIHRKVFHCFFNM